MSRPASPATLPAPRPPSGRARLSLALRRARRFLLWWSGALSALVIALVLLPVLRQGGTDERDVRMTRLAADTLRSAEAGRRAAQRLATAESALVVARRELAAPRPLPRPAPRAPVSAPAPAPMPAPPATAAPLDPRAAELERLIADARRLRTVAAWHAVAAHPSVAPGPRMRALAESLTVIAARRDAVPAGTTRDAQVAAFTQRLSRVGYTIVAIADNRRAELSAGANAPAVATPVASVATAVASAVVTDAPVRDAAPPDTLAMLATVATQRAARDSAIARYRAAQLELTALALQPRRALTLRWRDLVPAFVTLAVLLLGLALRLTIGLRRERALPRLAHAAEAERVTGRRVLAVVKDPPPEGPARFKPSGVDPFRMLYLGLTATGTRARAVTVVGPDPVITAAVAARLAIAAAADHRATLIVDLDAAEIALSRTFRERAEPGLRDVLARAFTWRDVARAVGSSDGLPLTLLPAGTERSDAVEGDARTALLEEFARFRGQFELTIVCASGAFVTEALTLVSGGPVVLSAETGVTPVGDLQAVQRTVEETGARVQGCVLWEVDRPTLPTRGELAALLSKQRGRTPGGSFEAVKRATGR